MKMDDIIKKVFNKETILYIIFGVLTTVVDFVSFGFLFYQVGLNEIVANTIAWIIAVIVAYVTNKLYVFEKDQHDVKTLLREIVSFVLARLFSLFITNLFLVFAKHVGMNMMLAKILISVVVVILNYFFSKLFIFKKD
ncbi:MAG: GtrA family protein [Clostridiales bacterium]|nr:GtrA family protein [Clostridiales bacterium]